MPFAHLTVEHSTAAQSAPASSSVLANIDRIRARVDSYLVPEDPALLNDCEACQ
jgi:hypothetical protein